MLARPVTIPCNFFKKREPTFLSYLTRELIIINRVNRSGGIINEMQSDHTLKSKRRSTGIGMYREMLIRYVFPHKKLLAALTVLLLFPLGSN